jgi:hypothetical protein
MYVYTSPLPYLWRTERPLKNTLVFCSPDLNFCNMEGSATKINFLNKSTCLKLTAETYL